MQSPIMPLPQHGRQLRRKIAHLIGVREKHQIRFCSGNHCDSATQYPSGVYASSKSCSTSKTSGHILCRQLAGQPG